MEVDPPLVELPAAKKLKMDSTNNLQLDIKELTQIMHYKKLNQSINVITIKFFQQLYSVQEIKNYFDSHNDLSTLKENNEKTVFVNLINATKSNELIIKILIYSDDQLISNVLRTCKKFFQDSNFTPQFYAQNIFNKISYSNRLKLFRILAKESKSDTRCNEFYDTLKSIYCANTARVFLPYCSKEFFLDKLQNGIALTEKELLILKKRGNEIAMFYLIEFSKVHTESLEWNLKFGISEYENVLILLMPYYLQEVVKIIETAKQFLNIKFGKRSSKRIVKNSKATITNDPNYFNPTINKNIIHHYLEPNEFEKYFQDLWPTKIRDFDYRLKQRNIADHIKYYKENSKKLEILVKLYNNIYKEDLLEISKISPELMLLLSDEDRIKYTKEKLTTANDKYLTPIEWTKFLDTKSSIQKYMDEIYITNDRATRMKYVMFMIESCDINNDYDTIVKILKYINQRHRNEQIDFRLNLFSSLKILNLNKFNEHHWNEMFELFEIISVNEEFASFHYSKKIFSSSLRFALEYECNLDKTVIYYLKWMPPQTDNHENLKDFFEKNPDKERIAMFKIAEVLPKIQDEISYCSVIGFYKWICSYNKFNCEKLPISVIDFDWAYSGLEKMFSQSSSYRHFLKGFYSCVQYDKKAEQIFHPKLRLKFDTKYFDEIMKYNFDLIKENRKEIAEKCLNIHYYSQFIEKHYKKLIQIDDMEDLMRNYCKRVLNEPENNLRYEALRFLSRSSWITENEFYEFAKDFYAVDKKPQNTRIFNLQKEILYCLKYYKYNPEALKVLKIFCQGDYLKISLGALYHICTKLPFDIIEKFLAESMDAPVSFKKHLIRIQLLIGEHEKNVIFLRNLWETETSPTIREILMDFILKNFINIDNDFIWKSMQSLTIKDRDIVEKLCAKVYIVPSNIQSDYIINCWEIVSKLAQNDFEIDRKKERLLNAINNKMDLMNTNFVEKLLLENLFKNNKRSTPFICIAVSFIFKKNEINRNFDVIFERVKLAVDNNWNDRLTSKNSYPTRSMIRIFIESFCETIIDKINYETNLLVYVEKLDDGLKKLFENPEMNIYTRYWTLKILQSLLKSNKNFTVFGKNLRPLINNVFINTPAYLLTKFLTNLQGFIQNNSFGEVESSVAFGLLEADDSEVITEGCALIAINLVGITNFFNNPELSNKVIKLQYNSIRIEIGNIE